jgi:hypothetical protein
LNLYEHLDTEESRFFVSIQNVSNMFIVELIANQLCDILKINRKYTISENTYNDMLNVRVYFNIKMKRIYMPYLVDMYKHVDLMIYNKYNMLCVGQYINNNVQNVYTMVEGNWSDTILQNCEDLPRVDENILEQFIN